MFAVSVIKDFLTLIDPTHDKRNTLNLTEN